MLPFPLLLCNSSESNHLISSGQVVFEFSVLFCLQAIFLSNPWCYNIVNSVVGGCWLGFFFWWLFFIMELAGRQ